MGKVKSIEKAVESLPPSELAELADFGVGSPSSMPARETSKSSKTAAAGKLDGLAAEALADYRAGSAREI